MTLPPWPEGRSFAARLALALAMLLLAYGAFVMLLGRQVASEYEQESTQRLSHGLARHIVEHWPEIASPDRDKADRAAREALLGDADDGRIPRCRCICSMRKVASSTTSASPAWCGRSGSTSPPCARSSPDRRCRCTEPIRWARASGASSAQRCFRRAATPSHPPGYLYIVLDGRARELVSAQLSSQRLWRSAAVVALLGLLVTLAIGLFTFRRLTLPLHVLARRMRDFSMHSGVAAAASGSAARAARRRRGAGDGDGVRRDDAAPRSAGRARAAASRGAPRDDRQPGARPAHAAHRLARPSGGAGRRERRRLERRDRVLQAALAQSAKVSRLSQQLFELRRCNRPARCCTASVSGSTSS